jgi:hypothetical protein
MRQSGPVRFSGRKLRSIETIRLRGYPLKWTLRERQDRDLRGWFPSNVAGRDGQPFQHRSRVEPGVDRETYNGRDPSTPLSIHMAIEIDDPL